MFVSTISLCENKWLFCFFLGVKRVGGDERKVLGLLCVCVCGGRWSLVHARVGRNTEDMSPCPVCGRDDYGWEKVYVCVHMCMWGGYLCVCVWGICVWYVICMHVNLYAVFCLCVLSCVLWVGAWACG